MVLDASWLIPALPLAGFVLLLVFGRRLGDPWAGWLATAARWHVLPAAPARFQPLDAEEAARAVVAVATTDPLRARTTVHALRSIYPVVLTVDREHFRPVVLWRWRFSVPQDGVDGLLASESRGLVRGRCRRPAVGHQHA